MTTTTSLPTGTITLFISDVEGSTILLQALGENYSPVLDRHRELIDQAIAEFGGTEVGTHGDEVFAVFTSSRAAVDAAIATQQALDAEPWPEGVTIRVRIGLHTGEPRLHQNNYVGLDVHRAARISAAGNGGQVLLSKETFEELEAAGVPAGIDVREIGWHRLKDLRYPELLFDLVIPGLKSDFPPLSSIGKRPNNLQEAQTDFVGRAAEIAAVTDLVKADDTKVVTLTGPGGAGKTRLSLAAGAELLDSFKNGVFQVTLANIRDPQLVMPAVGQTLGVPEFPGMSVLETLKIRLATSELLLILDNFEQVVPAAPQVNELLAACDGIKAMVTSREALRIRRERVYPVPPLGFPAPHEEVSAEELVQYDSIRLFVDRVRDFKYDFELTAENAKTVRAICAHLEGLPLAIELAASRVAVLSLDSLLDRLNQRMDILAGGQRDADERHHTINNMIDWSYELLEDGERALFDNLSVFAGGFTVEAAEEICGSGAGSDIEVLEGLMSLAAKSLLVSETVSGEPRLRMLEMIRNYAMRRLDASPHADEFRERHARHYTAVAEAMAPELQGRGQKELVVRILDDADNFRAALEWAVDQPSAELTGRLMTSLLWFWIPHGWFTEGLAWAERAIEQAKSVESAYERAVIEDVVGWLYIFAGDYGTALAHCKESLALFSTLDDASDIARTKMTLGITGAVTGEIEEGPEMIMEALAMYQEQEDPVGITLALIALGEGARAGGDTDAAEECYRSALELTVDMGNVYWQCHMLHNLAHFRLHEGKADAAYEMAAEALRLGEEYGYPMIVNLSIAALGGVAVARGEGKVAAQLFGLTDKLLSELGAVFEPLDHQEFEQNMASAKELLGASEFEAAFDEGHSWTLDQAVAVARSVSVSQGEAGAGAAG